MTSPQRCGASRRAAVGGDADGDADDAGDRVRSHRDDRRGGAARVSRRYAHRRRRFSRTARNRPKSSEATRDRARGLPRLRADLRRVRRRGRLLLVSRRVVRRHEGAGLSPHHARFHARCRKGDFGRESVGRVLLRLGRRHRRQRSRRGDVGTRQRPDRARAARDGLRSRVHVSPRLHSAAAWRALADRSVSHDLYGRRRLLSPVPRARAECRDHHTSTSAAR